jgi:hypothetical protein
VALQKSTSTDKSVAVHKAIDTSFISTQTNSLDYINYGDTLQGNVYAVDSSTVDTIESSGIKIIAVVNKQSNGIIKTNFTAIAKPKQIVNETNVTQTEQKDIATIDSAKKDLVVTTKDKEVESNNSLLIYGLIFLLIGIAGLVLYIYGQYKKWW